VVYSDATVSLVLTAFHVVKGDLESGSNIRVGYLTFDGVKAATIVYNVAGFRFDPLHDLALLEIHPGKQLPISLVAQAAPLLGEDIWLGTNPNLNYRSLKRGVVSSLHRVIGTDIFWELSGGVIFGSSGGGAFNTKGELIAVVHSVDAYPSELCGEEGCMPLMLPEMGYFVPLADVKRFLLLDGSVKYFDYLRGK
jgi:S1-C subfamily serine protease